jgi:hypothetical protein
VTVTENENERAATAATTAARLTAIEAALERAFEKIAAIERLVAEPRPAFDLGLAALELDGVVVVRVDPPAADGGPWILHLRSPDGVSYCEHRYPRPTRHAEPRSILTTPDRAEKVRALVGRLLLDGALDDASRRS